MSISADGLIDCRFWCSWLRWLFTVLIDGAILAMSWRMKQDHVIKFLLLMASVKIEDVQLKHTACKTTIILCAMFSCDQ